ncbi:hypothetical protein thsps21_52230 [Pseudomonas sp. No.21]|uniref:helix-turn-helix domain-containing protein n=1 Tax=Pseudomonas tohonis TaxID=2725477 RepID=UPI001F47C1A3|nr:helix-turn-helix domain-containing protein [Pseudomonas tohonis]GJN48511.1 hypothetical protein TUM20249_44970 [Pseudomonas tohonis]
MARKNQEKTASLVYSQAQQTRLLNRLQQGPVDTLTARSDLNILMPAARIKELRDLGYDIRTQRITLIDKYGHTHQGIALYYMLSAEPVARPTNPTYSPARHGQSRGRPWPVDWI